ncbi:unnamed protein product [Closterium sp. Naga37s-1]|nr:unnamed protein product [Closterium sp. Naga37s-1]
MDATRREGMGKSSTGPGSSMRSAATVRRLAMYKTRPWRNSKGHVLHTDLQSKALPNTRIKPDRRWFGNTRVVGQRELERFREELGSKVSDAYTVVLKHRTLPLSLLNHQPQGKARVHIVETEPFQDTFGPGAKRRRPKLGAAAEGYESLLQHSAEKQESFAGKAGGSEALTRAQDAEDGVRAVVRHSMFDKGQSRRIWGELFKVLDSSDVVVQVLDARDPMGTRCTYLEKHLRDKCPHKHLLLLLNKCDLVPSWVAKGWLRTLSREYPTLAFHASITNPFGKGSLLSLLRQVARLKSDKQAISVGFIGYPNVGKSSVINTLRTKKVCSVAPVPGETKVWQYITLMKRIFLIDCPGVVYADARDSETNAVLKGVVRVANLEDADQHIPDVLNRVKPAYISRAYGIEKWCVPCLAPPPPSSLSRPTRQRDSETNAVLKGVVRVANLEDADQHIPDVLNRVKPAYISRAYGIEKWEDATDFLSQMAKRSGKLLKGGEPDVKTAAKMVLHDWQRGKIPFFTPPPDSDALPHKGAGGKAAGKQGAGGADAEGAEGVGAEGEVGEGESAEQRQVSEQMERMTEVLREVARRQQNMRVPTNAGLAFDEEDARGQGRIGKRAKRGGEGEGGGEEGEEEEDEELEEEEVVEEEDEEDEEGEEREEGEEVEEGEEREEGEEGEEGEEEEARAEGSEDSEKEGEAGEGREEEEVGGGRGGAAGEEVSWEELVSGVGRTAPQPAKGGQGDSEQQRPVGRGGKGGGGQQQEGVGRKAELSRRARAAAARAQKQVEVQERKREWSGAQDKGKGKGKGKKRKDM